MDDTEIELLKKLLSNKDVKETLKKILLEDEPVKKTPVKKAPVKKMPTKKTVLKEVKQRKPRVKKEKEPNKIVDKNSKEYGRKYFKDNLKDCIIEEIDGKKINLIEESKKLSKIAPKKEIREKQSVPKNTCGQCNNVFEGFGYLCNNCLGAKSAK